jgi:hypothetical protein
LAKWPKAGDEQQGGWWRQQREEMDQRFTDAMASTLRSGQKNPPACRDGELTRPRRDAILLISRSATSA